jgi:hypothetical protein
VGIFIETQIRAVINDDLFEHRLAESEKPVWLKFKAAFQNLRGNVNAENYKELILDLKLSPCAEYCMLSSG